MASTDERIQALLRRIEMAWEAFQQSYDGVPESWLREPDSLDGWSVKDVLAHVTTWEQEALKILPVIIQGGRPAPYSAQGGIDAFNARMVEEKRDLSLPEVRRQAEQTHQRLMDFVRGHPGEHFAKEGRTRRRLRLDSYGHYREHTEQIRVWREERQRQAGT